MCLLVLAWQAHPRYRLIVAANRDEFHDRPAAPLARWEGPAGMLAGRDLRAGGTWLGADAQGRMGVITNFRDLQKPRSGAPSRGALIPAFLEADRDPDSFFSALATNAAEYSGFNLLLADRDSLWYGSNRAQPFARPLAAGVHGLSNHLLDTPWPKLLRVRARFETWLATKRDAADETLFEMLADRTTSEHDDSATSASIPPELRKALSAPFVEYLSYGTRCSTVLLIGHDGTLRITERRFDALGLPQGETVLELPAQ